MRDQGPGPDRRTREGRRDQGRQGPRRGRGARQRDPRHGHPRPHRPRAVGGGRLRDRGRVLRICDLRPLREGAPDHALDQGRHGHRGGGGHRPGCDCPPPRRPAARVPGLPRPPARLRGRRRRGRGPADRRDAGQAVRRVRAGGGDAGRGQPADRHAPARGQGARRQGHTRRQRPVPASRQCRAARPLGRGPAGADGQGARPDLRQAGRQHRDPRQRRRARDVDARRGRPGRWRAGKLPRRRRWLEGRRDHQRGRGDSLRRQGEGRAVQHLRWHHSLRRGCQGPDRGLRPDQADRPVRRPPRRHQRRRGAAASGRGEPARTCTPSRRWTARRRGSWSWQRHEHPRRQQHQALRIGDHRPRGHLPLAAQPRLRHPGRGRRHARQGRPGRRRASRCSTPSTTPSTAPAPTRR